MKKTLFFLTTTMFLLLSLNFNLPKNWFKAGSQPKNYEMGVENGAAKDGGNAAFIKSNYTEKKNKSKACFGTLMQQALPDKYLGKRVKMSGFLKSKDVTGWAGFWMRVDQKNSVQALSFDNMEERAIKGTSDWQQYEIILDVPQNASAIAYGVLLSGAGNVWFSDINFEIVSELSEATTNMDNVSLLSEPSNLNFEE